MKRVFLVSLLILLAGIFPSGPGSAPFAPLAPFSVVQPACAQDWRAEFDDICRKTDASASLSKDELKQLISRCEKLRTTIETLAETEKKVFLKRLRLCQDLFVFVLESKEKE